MSSAASATSVARTIFTTASLHAILSDFVVFTIAITVLDQFRLSLADLMTPNTVSSRRLHERESATALNTRSCMSVSGLKTWLRTARGAARSSALEVSKS